MPNKRPLVNYDGRTGELKNADSLIFGSGSVIGTSDQVQFTVKAFTTQTNNILEVQDGSTNNLFYIDGNGNPIIKNTLAYKGRNAADSADLNLIGVDGSDVITVGAGADKTVLSDQPTGAVDLAIATTKYVDDAVAVENTWDRTGSTLTTAVANNDVQIDSHLRINGSADIEQVIVKGNATQTSNLQEWQNSIGSTLTSISNTGKLIFTSAGLVDFGNWTLSESGVTLNYTLSGGIRAAVQNGLHATYGWELSWQNTSNSNRFGFTSPSEGYVELRGTKNITTSPMSFSAYNTYTNSSNYERAVFDWKTTSNVLTIGTQALGTGTVRPIEIEGAGTTVIGTNTTDVTLTAKGVSSQTNNLQEWQDSSSTVLAEMSKDGEFRSNSYRETKVTSSATETLSVKNSTYIDIDTSGKTLSLSNMVDGSKMQLHNSSGGDATLNFDIKVGTTTFSAPVTMPSGDSYELVYDSGSSTWVM